MRQVAGLGVEEDGDFFAKRCGERNSAVGRGRERERGRSTIEPLFSQPAAQPCDGRTRSKRPANYFTICTKRATLFAMRVSASHARERFAELLDRAIAGEEIQIGRHGRLVARIVPAGREHVLPADLPREAIAEARGVPPDSAIARVFRERALRRLRIARPRAEAAVRKLEERGAKARIVGSLARGAFRQNSDVDLLIENRGGLARDAIEAIVRREMRDFPFDVLYADRLPTGLKRHLVASAGR